MPPSIHDHTLAARGAARVVNAAGDAVGAGFPVGPDLVATCAHVVATAIGGDAYAPAAPTNVIQLDFPLLDESATAVVQRWLPIQDNGTGDIAVLRLLGEAPAGARMPPLRRVDQLWDERFRVLGFPEGLADGVWSTGRIRGAQGTHWFQLQASLGDQPIVEGFSGAAVWHEETGAVVGMTVAADRSGTTTTAYLIPVEQILGADPELLPCPYRGLEPFGEEHAEFFFGRGAAVGRLVDAVAAHPMVAVAGPSGVGKSSLVRAGLLPRLRAGGSRIVLLYPAPGQPIEPALSAALDGPDDDVVLVVDQFEELAATEPHAAQDLLERLGELVRGPASIKAVLTLRSATLDDVVVPRLAELLNAGTVLVPPMERGQLREAIVAPAERAPGLSFEMGLVDRILDDAATEPGQLPLVESVLTELWNRRDGGYLTLGAYERAGGVAGVVAVHAESVMAGFTDPGDEPKLRRLFTALAAPDREGRFVRTPLPWADLATDLRPLVQRLAAGRLIVIERSATGAEHVQLAHQALIAHWPRLRDWLTDDRDFLAWRTQIEQQRERWEAADRDDGALLRGTALATAQDWLPARTADVSAANQEYVRRSHTRQRQEVRRWRIVTAVLAVLVLAAGALSAVAINSRNEADKRLRLANAELVAQAALANEQGDPVTATALALTAWRADSQNAAARTAMFRMSMATRSVDHVFPSVVDQPVLSFSASDDGNTLVVREGRGAVVLIGARGDALQRWTLPGVPPGLDRFFVGPDGNYVAATGGSRAVYLWDVANRRGPTVLEPAGDQVVPFTVEFSTHGNMLSWLSDTPAAGVELVVRDITNNAVVPHGLGVLTGDRVTGFSLTADPEVGIEIAAVDDDVPARLTARSLVDGSTVAQFPPDSVVVRGDMVLSCARDAPAQAVAWSAVTGAQLRRLDLLTDRCSYDYLHRRSSGDGRHLMEHRAPTRDRDSDVYRITSLSDGRTFDLTAPPGSTAQPQERVPSGTVIVPGDRDRLDVLLPAASSILRLHAVADTGGALPGVPWMIGLTDDQRFEVAISADRYTVLEPGTRKVLGTLERSTLRDQGDGHQLVKGDRFTIRTKAADHWSYVEFALPSLAPINRYVIRPPGGQAGLPEMIGIATSADRVALMASGVVGVFDRRTGRLVGEPINLATTPERRNHFASARHIALRPGPGGQVAVIGPDGLELWNPVTRAREGTIRLPTSSASSSIVLDPSGTRAAVRRLDFSVRVLDLEHQVVETEPFLLPGLGLLKGFTADGNIAVLMKLGDSVWELAIWDPRTRRKVGSLRLSAAHDFSTGVTTDGEQLMAYGRYGALPVTIPLTPQAWYTQLCRITDRPFTDTERALIPAGTDVERPCG